MFNRKLIVIIGIFLVLGVLVSYKLYKKNNPPKEVHYHAGFVVFQNGQKVDFSDSKYMFIKPCNVNTKATDSPATAQLEKAHLHDGVGDVVHVEADGAKWGDLFTNIGYQIDYASASGYINRTLVPDFQNIPIKAYDSLVIFIGKVDTTLLSQAVTIDRIKSVEKTSVECGK